MAVTDIGAEANALFDQLSEGVDITIPEIDLSGPEYDYPFDSTSEIYKAVVRPSICDITDGDVEGSGAFDKIMRSVGAHLKSEYEANRITGAEYTKAYIALVESSMSNATQFVLSRDMTFWQAQQAQLAAITARIQLQTAKVQMAQLLFSALREKAAYVLAKMQALGAAVDYKTSEYTLENILPQQKDLLTKQNAGETLRNEGLDLENQVKNYNLVNILPKQLATMTAEIEGRGIQNAGGLIENQSKTYTLANILPVQKNMIEAQVDGQLAQTEGLGIENSTRSYTLTNMLPKQLEALIGQIEAQETQTLGYMTENDIKSYNLTTMLPLQRNLLSGQIDTQAMQTEGLDLDNQTKNFNLITMLPKQYVLISEQVEAARAQTLDTRTDGVTVVGSLGKQKELYSQQITSYQRRSEMDAAKFWVDAWTVQKSIDEGLTPPSNFTNTNVDSVLSKIRVNNNLS